MDKKKFAVIGSAHGHIRSFIKDMLEEGHKFAGVYDDGLSLCKEISSDNSVPLFNDIDEILNKNVDVVGTSAINNEKINIIEKCNQYSTHVIADKPLVVDHNQYERLESIVNEGKIEVGLMLTERFSPQIQTIKKLIDNNEIGELLSVEHFAPHNLHPETRDEWHFNKKQNGGVIIDLMIHAIDVFNWFTDDEVSNFEGIMQKSILPEKESFYDSAQVFVESRRGCSGYLRADWHMPSSHRLGGDMRIFCTGSQGIIEGRVSGDPVTGENQLILFKEGEKTREVAIEKGEGSSVTRDFLDRIDNNDYVIGHEDILRATELTIDIDNKVRKVNLT